MKQINLTIDIKAEFEAAERARKNDNLDLAMMHLERVVNADPGNVRAYHGIVRIHIKNRCYLQAEEIISRAAAHRVDLSGHVSDIHKFGLIRAKNTIAQLGPRLRAPQAWQYQAPVDLGNAFGTVFQPEIPSRYKSPPPVRGLFDDPETIPCRFTLDTAAEAKELEKLQTLNV